MVINNNDCANKTLCICYQRSYLHFYKLITKSAAHVVGGLSLIYGSAHGQRCSWGKLILWGARPWRKAAQGCILLPRPTQQMVADVWVILFLTWVDTLDFPTLSLTLCRNPSQCGSMGKYPRFLQFLSFVHECINTLLQDCGVHWPEPTLHLWNNQHVHHVCYAHNVSTIIPPIFFRCYY